MAKNPSIEIEQRLIPNQSSKLRIEQTFKANPHLCKKIEVEDALRLHDQLININVLFQIQYFHPFILHIGTLKIEPEVICIKKQTIFRIFFPQGCPIWNHKLRVDFPSPKKLLYMPGWSLTGLEIMGFHTKPIKLPSPCYSRINHLTSLVELNTMKYDYPPNYSWEVFL